jgi:hypothetical protein
MNHIIRSAVAAGAIFAGTAVGELHNPSVVEAAPATTCFDKNGGIIDATDFDIKAVQTAVGAASDGIFGPVSCKKTIEAVVRLGYVSSETASLKIGDKVLGWLGIATKPNAPEQQPPAPENGCVIQTSADVKAIQLATGSLQDGKFGKISCKNLIATLKKQGLVDKGATSVTLTDALAEKAGIDNDTQDRAACNKVGKCVLVHAVLGKNKIELYDNGELIDSTLVNTGKAGMRTRNGSFTIGAESFKGDGVRISRDNYGNLSSGRLGDPHFFSGGQAFHWRVNYDNGTVGTKMTSDTAFDYDKWLPAYENNTYNGGYASHGCVHTPHDFLQKYDNAYFIKGVKVVVRDQPAK